MIERHAKKVTYTVVDTLGTFTRTTQRVYRVVVLMEPCECPEHPAFGSKTGGIVSWHATRALAGKSIAQYRRWWNDKTPDPRRFRIADVPEIAARVAVAG